jgi:transglutaminase-like putative cysteine protease
MRPSPRLASAALLLGCCAALAAPRPHDVLRVPRPAGTEYFGLYLLDKKVGWLSTSVSALPSGDVATDNRLAFIANVGGRRSERHHREQRTYDGRPGGKLKSFVFEQQGDGGDQTLVGTCLADKLTVRRTRPGQAEETLTFPPCTERTEAADPVRVALLRSAPVAVPSLDFMDLKHWDVRTTPEGTATRNLGGVPTRLRTVTSFSEKEKVPVKHLVTDEGEILEVNFGANFLARAESEQTAKRQDVAEVFELTRVVLPRPLPPATRKVPGEVRLVLSGLPGEFHETTARQSYEKLADGRVALTLRAPPPPAKPPRFPLADPETGPNLEATLAVESSAPAIRELSAKLVKGQPDAWAAARAVNRWVYENVEKNYGTSSDRATDVLRQRKGDCTEHSLLTVSLLRAAGIPARRVDGLVYLRQSDDVPAFYWHEWVEAWVGEWVQMDPTFNEDVALATHLALGLEGDARITPLLGTLKVHEVR